MRNPFGLSAAELRQRAMLCAAEAARAKTADDREAFLKQREALLALAENEDWLGGQRPFAEKIASLRAAE
jgi:hypothetical protein